MQTSPSSFSLLQRLPKFEELSNEIVLDRFLDYAADKDLELYPAQEEALLALIDGQNVILNTPTGSGKSLVATALHFHSLAMGKRSIYTCPIKALVNEKFLALCRDFGPDQVGMITGDGSVNPQAPILCCTAEILANLALREGAGAAIDDVIMDEFHYYSDRERGAAWQIPLLTLERARFLLMSATLGDAGIFGEKLTELNGRETAVIANAERPVPLHFEYRETPLHETLGDLLERGAAPVYVVNFTQREAAEEAQNLMSVDVCAKEQKKAIGEAIRGVDFSSPYGKEIQKFIKHGIGLHHAGLLPKYRILVENLAQRGLLRVICGTDTLGVGVNIPIRTVLLTKLCKYDGEKTALLSVRDFHQIAGRAGRKGFDDEGRVVAQAPRHVIENRRLEAKAKADPKKAKKIVKAKPPEKGFVPWNRETFQKLIESRPETLQSRFAVSHGMILNVLSRESEDGCLALRQIIRRSHESEGQKRKHRKLAFTLFRSLLQRSIIEIIPGAVRGEKRIRVNVDLQEDFSLNHAFSLYLIDTIQLLDRESETYALDLLTLVESILESPDLILRKQLDRLKGEKLRELKEAGVEYEQRMEELERLEHPKPLRDFIYATFNEFSDRHPWVGTDNIRPKSVAREMFETYQSFAEYIREYDLQRAEGLLLRYITDVYRVLTRTVPDSAKTDAVDQVTSYFGEMARAVDASLMEEWERIRDGGPTASGTGSGAGGRSGGPSVTSSGGGQGDLFSDEKALRLRIFNEIFRFLRTLSIGDLESGLEILRRWSEVNQGDDSSGTGEAVDGSDEPWSAERLEQALDAYLEAGHGGIRTDSRARGTEFTRIEKGDETWRIEQILVDPDDHNDWRLVLSLDVDRSRKLSRPVLRLEGIEGL